MEPMVKIVLTTVPQTVRVHHVINSQQMEHVPMENVNQDIKETTAQYVIIIIKITDALYIIDIANI